MATYVDSLVDYGWRLGPSCHLIADSIEELHEFARAIGLKRDWFQGPPKARCPHYDLTSKRRERALARGALALKRSEFVMKMREIRSLTGT